MRRNLTALFVFTLAGPATAEVLQVPTDFTTVTEAVRAAETGDRIVVAAGEYSRRLGEEFPLVLADRDLVIQGAGAGRSVLDAEGSARIVHFTDGDASCFEGFTLTGGFSTGSGAAIRVDGASPELARLHFTGNESLDGGDALAVIAGEPHLTNCLFERNGPDGPTISVTGGSPILEQSTLHRNGGTGLEIHGNASALIRRIIVSRPGEPAGRAVGLRLVPSEGLGALLVEENLFDACFDGTVLIEGNSEDFLDALLEDARRADGLREGDPLFLAPERGDFRVDEFSPARLVRSREVEELGAFGGPEPLLLERDAEDLTRSRDTDDPGLLRPSVPNPASPASTIHFTVKKATVVDLGVYNVLGQRVRTLHAGDLPAGEHTRRWDGRDDTGVDLPPGIYFVRVTEEQVTQSQRLVLVR